MVLGESADRKNNNHRDSCLITQTGNACQQQWYEFQDLSNDGTGRVSGEKKRPNNVGYSTFSHIISPSGPKNSRVNRGGSFNRNKSHNFWGNREDRSVEDRNFHRDGGSSIGGNTIRGIKQNSAFNHKTGGSCGASVRGTRGRGGRTKM